MRYRTPIETVTLPSGGSFPRPYWMLLGDLSSIAKGKTLPNHLRMKMAFAYGQMQSHRRLDKIERAQKLPQRQKG